MDFDRLNNNSLSYSEPSSPDHFSASTGFDDNSLSSLPDHMLPFSMSTGLLAPPVPACNPQYEDPAAASLSSLQRILFEAEVAYKRGEFPVNCLSSP